MKYSYVLTLVFLFSSQVFGEEETTFVADPEVQWVRYLSNVEKSQITTDLAIEEMNRLKASGELSRMLELPIEENAVRKVTFPGSFKQKSQGKSSSRNAGGPGAGNVTCSFNVQAPHAGSGPGGSFVVKAKSNGTCNYQHVSGQMPPTITWDLNQVLVDHGEIGNGGPNVANEFHVRNGLSTTWSASSAQVFFSTCNNGLYSHADFMFVYPPAGWTYNGPQPIPLDFTVNSVNNC